MEYRVCPYFSDVLIALGGMEEPEETENDEKGKNEKRRQREKRARQFSFVNDGLIRQRATGKLGVPTSLR